jgi:hypothetical protein
MKKIVITAAAAAVVLTGCSPISTIGSTAKSSSRSTVTLTQPVPTRAASPTLEADPTDPYSSTGTWLVPEEIAPGTYRVTLLSNRSGYTAVCADFACRPGPGMIGNDIHDGPGVLVVPPDAVAVELKNVELTPMGR